MIRIEKIDRTSKKRVNRFVNIPYRLYANHPQWAPPLIMDSKLYLDVKKHPFYNHSEADFFIAVRNGQDVGRIAVLEHRLFNQHHGTQRCQFYLFECEHDLEAATALFDRAYEWAKERNLTEIVGPKGFSMLDSLGMLVDGFDHQQTMTISSYNYDYYPELLESLGFVKELDYISCQMSADTYQFPDWIETIANEARQKGDLTVRGFRNMRELLSCAAEMLKTYNTAMLNNWENYPYPDYEISFIIDTLKVITNPKLMKVIYQGERIVGILFAFPDLSIALQRAKGRLTPLSLIDLLLQVRRSKRIVLNGLGILPEFRLGGGNALLFSELAKTVEDFGIQQVELPQMADTAVAVRRDLATVGIKPYKTHRIYVKQV